MHNNNVGLNANVNEKQGQADACTQQTQNTRIHTRTTET